MELNDRERVLISPTWTELCDRANPTALERILIAGVRVIAHLDGTKPDYVYEKLIMSVANNQPTTFGELESPRSRNDGQ